MTVQPFTADGVSQKQTELYALSDAALLTEAQAIASGLAAWLNVNFSLSVKQQAYLDGMPDAVKFHFGAVIAAAVISRSPITMATPPDNYGPPRRTKQITIDPCGETWYAPPLSGSGGIGGSLSVNITYELID